MTLLTISGLFDMNLQRVERWHPVSGLNELTPLEWAGAMCGEAGEAANAAKKLKRLECGIKSINESGRHYDDVEKARCAVAKEVADTIIYGLLLMARIGVKDPDLVLREVFNQKSEEYGFPERI